MAIKEELDMDINVRVNGADSIDDAVNSTNRLRNATEQVNEAEAERAGTFRDGANATLENGGAMGLLNDLTGGYAMMAKDAVEASALFTKESKLAAAAQKAYSFVVGASTGGLKLFRLALAGTGIGLIVLGVIALFQNFGKLKDMVLNLVPGLKIVGDIFGGLVDFVTDFIGVTSDASREIDKLNEAAQKGMKQQELDLELNGDKYDEFTKRKIQADIDYRKKLDEIAKMDTNDISDEERLKFMQDAHAKMLREVKKADDDSRAELDKTLDSWRKKQEDANAKTNMDKIALERKRSLAEIENIRASETEKGELRKKINAYYDGQALQEQDKLNQEAERKRDEAIAKEKARRESIKKILDDYRKREEDAEAITTKQKLKLEQDRAIAELNALKATREQKEKVNKYYDKLRKKEEERLEKERLDIIKGRITAEQNLEFDRRQWEIDHEQDPMKKLKAEKKLLQDQAQQEIDALQLVADNQELTEKERADAQNQIAMAKQNRDQAIRDNELNQLALETEREDERLAKQKQRLEALDEKRQDVNYRAVEWLDKMAHADEKRTDDEIDRDIAVANNRYNIGMTTAKALLDLAGKGSELSKGVAEAQAVQDTLKGANAAYAALAGIPIVGPGLGAVAYGAAMVQGYGNVKKILATKAVEKSVPSGGGAAAGGASVPTAPAFNIVEGTGSNQIAEAVANAGSTPIQAYVVSSNVTSAQNLERNIVSESLI